MAIFRMAPEYWNIFSIFRTVLVVIWLVWTFKICTGKSPIYHKSLSERCLLTRGDQIKKNPSNLMIPAFHCFQFPTIFYILDAILFDTLYIIVGFTDKLVLLVWFRDLQAHVQLHTKAHMRYTKANDKRKTSQAKPHN